MRLTVRDEIRTASPIIIESIAKVVNQVRPTSASQPLTPGASANIAAVKCQR